MERNDKLVIQVTIRAQEYPTFFRELSAMTAHKQRANVLARMAYFGWLLERNGLQMGVMMRTQEVTPGTGQLVEFSNAPRIGDWLSDLGGSDEPEEQADGTPAA